MNKTKERKIKYIKEKYFEVYDRNPFQYCPKSDKTLHLSPISIGKIINLLIHVLEKESEDWF